MKKRLCLWMLLPMLLLGGCGVGNKMEDGFYTAEMAEYSHGWKEYLCIFVKNDKIVYAEFNARNESGYIKAWDNGYMGNMLAGTGTYPNAYTRAYVAQLVETQDPDEIMEQAKKGDSSIVVVEE